jgi:hypothetical protein
LKYYYPVKEIRDSSVKDDFRSAAGKVQDKDGKPSCADSKSGGDN